MPRPKPCLTAAGPPRAWRAVLPPHRTQPVQLDARRRGRTPDRTSSTSTSARLRSAPPSPVPEPKYARRASRRRGAIDLRDAPARKRNAGGSRQRRESRVRRRKLGRSENVGDGKRDRHISPFVRLYEDRPDVAGCQAKSGPADPHGEPRCQHRQGTQTTAFTYFLPNRATSHLNFIAHQQSTHRP